MHTIPITTQEKTILLIDDDTHYTDSVVEYLQTCGYKMICTHGGLEGITEAKMWRPDLILLDVKMPGMDGYEVCKQLKSTPITCEIPVLFITSTADVDSKIKGFEAGAVDYITKPFQPREMLARIQQHLYVQALQTQLKLQNQQLIVEIAQRQQAESELTKLNSELEGRVAQRTAELESINARLFTEISDRKVVEKELRHTQTVIKTNQERMQLLYTLSQMIDEPETVIQDFALDAAVRITNSEIGYIYFMNEDETILSLYAWSKTVMEQCQIAKPQTEYVVAETGLWGEAVRQRRPIITNDYSQPHPAKRGYPEGHVPITRHMNLPVIDDGKIVIIAGVGNKAQPYTETDVQQLTLLMETMWRLVQKKHANQALQESEERYRAIFEQAGNPIILVDSETGQIAAFNDHAHQILGYSREEYKNLAIPEFDVDDTPSKVAKRIQEVVKTGGIIFETRHRKKNGQILNILVNARRITINGKRFVQSIMSDITSQKQAELLLRIQRDLAMRLTLSADLTEVLDSVLTTVNQIEGVDCGRIYFLDKTTQEFNPVAHCGVAPNLLIAQYLSFTEPELAAVWNGEPLYITFDQLLEPKIIEQADVKLESLAILPILHEGQLIGLLNVASNTESTFSPLVRHTLEAIAGQIGGPITLARAEDTLRQTQRKYVELVDTIDGIVWEADAQTFVFNFVSQQAERLLGYPIQQWLSDPNFWRDHIVTEDREKSVNFCVEQTNACQDHEFEYRMRAADGRIIWLRDFVNVISETGKAVTLRGVMVDVTQQKIAEEAMRRSEQKYRHLFEYANDSIFIIDPETEKILDANANAAKKSGYAREELLELTFNQLYDHPKSGINGNFLESDSLVFEHEQRRQDRSLMPVEISNRLVPYDDKTVLLSIARDITERKKAEAKLRQLSQAVEQSPTSIIITDPNGKIEYVNHKCSQITGYEPEEMLGRNPRVLKSGHTSPELYKTLWNTITSKQEWRGEFLNRKKNGELFWEAASISPIVDENGRITHYLAVKEDITHQKAMQEQLQKHNMELQLLNNASKAISSSLNLDIVLINILEEMRRILAVTSCSIWLREESSGELVCRQVIDTQANLCCGHLPLGKGIAGWVVDHNESILINNLANEQQVPPIDFIQNDDIASVLTVPLRAQNSVIGAFQLVDQLPNRFSEHELYIAESLAIVAGQAIENARLHENLQHQIIQLRDAKGRLLQSEKLAAIGELIAGVAHELNNPLAGTILYAQLLQAKGVQEEVRRDLDQIVAQSRRASNIVHGLLDFARQRPPERVPTQINNVLRSTIELLAYELRTHNVEVFTQLGELPLTQADPHQLQQVFVNLVNNALHEMSAHTTGNRHLAITTETGSSRFQSEPEPQQVIRISFQDNGRGIPYDIQSRIFDPFFTTKALGEGTGLGLSVCHGIISEHGGHIWVESQVGSGATFVVELPMLEIAAPDKGHANLDDSTSNHSQSTRRVLILDDEPGILTIITRILRRAGYHADAVQDGYAGLEQLASHNYDIILCDLRMPGMDGPTFYHHVSQKHPHLAKRFIFTTGDTVSGSTRDFLNGIEASWLTKPFEMDELVQIVSAQLSENSRT